MSKLTAAQQAILSELAKEELALHEAVQPHWIPHQPQPRQKLFLELDCEEGFYGGAAGGGKSDALLMGALAGVNIRGYAALLLRRTYADLSLPDAIMSRAHQWLGPTPAKWSEKDKTWTFPSGATLTFGYLETENDKYRYQGSAYQFIGFDELTQFTDSQYLYLFSRLRRLATGNVPLRMRSASNPGGVGAEWVKARFIPDEFMPGDAVDPTVWWKEGPADNGSETLIRRAFVPARLYDNVFLDQRSYLNSLDRLDKVTRAQLLEGDWTITQTGRLRFDAEMIALFIPKRGTDGHLVANLQDNGETIYMFRPQPSGPLALWTKPQRGHRYVIGADTAQGKDVNKGEGTAKGDYSVAQVRDADTGEQVARYRYRISERGFAKDLYNLLRWFGPASSCISFLVPEVAGGYGRAMLDHLVLDLGWPMANVYRRSAQGVGNPVTSTPVIDDLGWNTNVVTAPQMDSALDTAILEHAIETYDPVTINEYLAFEYDKNGKVQARHGCHDDCVRADELAVIGIQRWPAALGRKVDLAAMKPKRYQMGYRDRLKEMFR